MMYLRISLSLLAIVVGEVASQAGPWAQCGSGSGQWTGPTSCVSGYYCAYTNQWYSQCLPGQNPNSSVRPSTISATTLSVATTTRTASRTSTIPVTSSRTTTRVTTTRTTTASTSPASATISGACPSWSPVTAAAAFKALNPGWNLGNTLDAIPNEGSWNNPPAQLLTFQQIKAKGFQSVRVPVTWTYHFTTQSPDFTIDPTWMDRVEVVIDQALSTGLWVILNVHHDSFGWMDYAGGMDIATIEAKFSKLWSQIGTRFRCKSSKLIFEAINEPTGTTEAHAIELNKLNDIFLTSINNAGGNNPQRVVSLSGLYMDPLRTTRWFKRGSLFPNQPWGLQFHYYNPYEFIFVAWGRTVWGSDADKALLTSEFEQVAGNFTGVPIFIGEWDASPTNTEAAARWKYNDYLIREANRLGFSTVLWDNGLDHFLRPSNTWVDETAIDVIFKAIAGVRNALPESTTDILATSQTSSAYIFHKVGASVAAQSVKYTLNGNTLVSIKTATGAVVPTSAYTLAGDGTLTFTQAYLSTVFPATAAPGIKATLTLEFTPGADLTLWLVQFGTPTAPTTTYSLSSISSTSDLSVPINWAGLPAIAAIKALKADGTYFQDEWTQWRGPLEQARWSYGNWVWKEEGLVIYAAGVQLLKAAGQGVTLTLEFFPRTLGENNLTIQFNP